MRDLGDHVVGRVVRLEAPDDAGNAFAATAWEMLAGGFVMLPFGLTPVGSFAPSTSSILAWLYLVTIGSVVGYTAYTWLLANAPLGLVSTYAYVNPVVAILLGLLFRNEQLTWRILIGAAIVVSAVAVVVRKEPPCRDPARGGRSLEPTISSSPTGARGRSRPVASRSAATTAAVETTVGGSPTPLTP